ISTATSKTAGAGKSHWAWRCAQRVSTRSLVLRPVQQILKVLLRLGEDLGRWRPLDRLLDGDADDVTILRDPDDLRQALAADLQRRLIGLVPVSGHLPLGLHPRIVPGPGTAHAHTAHELVDHVRSARPTLCEGASVLT